MGKTALITGITGQDGSYLAELLLTKGYKVHGIIRKISKKNKIYRLWRIKHFMHNITLHTASLENYTSLFNIIKKVKPNEIYHLAAQSYGDYLFQNKTSTLNTNINGTLNLLTSLEKVKKNIKFYFASSSEMFGKVKQVSLDENATFQPDSTYAVSKIAGYHLTKKYREDYKIHASTGILFNHESPRRGLEFVTRKISLTVALIKNGFKKKLTLGNIKSKRDWGHAKDYVRAMWLMLQQNTPEDYVIGTGTEHTVEDFAKKAFHHVGLNYKDYIIIDKKFARPLNEDITPLANYSRAKKKLKWEPIISFNDLVINMVESDLEFIDKYGYKKNKLYNFLT